MNLRPTLLLGLVLAVPATVLGAEVQPPLSCIGPQPHSVHGKLRAL